VSADPRLIIVCSSSRGGLGAAADPEWLTRQIQNAPKANLRFYLDVGTQETGKTPGGPICDSASIAPLPPEGHEAFSTQSAQALA